MEKNYGSNTSDNNSTVPGDSRPDEPGPELSGSGPATGPIVLDGAQVGSPRQTRGDGRAGERDGPTGERPNGGNRPAGALCGLTLEVSASNLGCGLYL